VRLRVGALPTYPSNALNYNLTWSTDGVINEYCEPCEAIIDGELRQARALEECEAFALDGVAYEAFNTSGGLGTLCETLAGKVRNLNYRTIRYPGHAAIMKMLLNDLRLRDRRDLLKDILEHAVPSTVQDVVIVFVTVSGVREGRLVQETYANKIYAREQGGRDAERHPDHHGLRPLRRARPAGPGPSAAGPASCGRKRSRWPTSWPTGLAAPTPRAARPSAGGRGVTIQTRSGPVEGSRRRARAAGGDPVLRAAGRTHPDHRRGSGQPAVPHARRGAGCHRQSTQGFHRLARRSCAAAGRVGAALGPGAARGQGRSRRAGHTRDRQDRLGRPRRGPGDDRHLRLRRWPVAAAVRPDHRQRAAGAPDDGGVAAAGRGRRHLGVQLSGRGVELERGAGPGLPATPWSGSRRRRPR